MNDKGILLESGTNELEIVEFMIAGIMFGINVAKVKEIMPYSTVTAVPNSHPCVKGIFKPRDIIMPVIDLPYYLGLQTSPDETKDMYIVTHFNKLTTTFQVHSVLGIHRISWKDIDRPDATVFGGSEGLATGIVKINDRLILILDFEKILADISPKSGIQMDDLQTLGYRDRSEKHVLIAEDSEMLTKMLLDALTHSGYTNVTCKPDGEQAWDYLQTIKNSCNSQGEVSNHVDCLITDIEMPKMDGHHLTKLVKTDEILKQLPVIIFSSLISEDMRRKGELLGANAQISKPEILDLVTLVDRYSTN